MARAKVINKAYKQGYAYTVVISEDGEYWMAISYHETRRQAQEAANDFNEELKSV